MQLHTRDKNMFFRPIKLHEYDNIWKTGPQRVHVWLTSPLACGMEFQQTWREDYELEVGGNKSIVTFGLNWP